MLNSFKHPLVPVALFQRVVSQQVVHIIRLINNNIWSIANRPLIVKLLSAITADET